MRFSPLLLLAQAAALSTAFLLPPEMSGEGLGGLDLPIDIGSGLALSKASMSRIVRIPCDGCLYKEEGVETDLVLNFNLPENNHTTMKLNGIPIFPLNLVNPQFIPLTATQMPHDVDTVVYFVDKEDFPKVTLDHSRLISSKVIPSDGFTKHTFELDILAVDDTPVTIQGVRMVVMEAPNGALAFGRVDPIPKGQGCGTDIKCMINKMIGSIRDMKVPSWGGKKGGCKGKHGNSVAEGLQGLDMHPPHHNRPHRYHPHHHHQDDSRPHYRKGKQNGPTVAEMLLLDFFILVTAIIGARFSFGISMRLANALRERCCPGRHSRYLKRMERARLAALEGDVEEGLLQEQEGENIECLPAYVEQGLEVAAEKE